MLYEDRLFLKNDFSLKRLTFGLEYDQVNIYVYVVTATGRVWIFVYTVNNCGES